MDYWKLNEDQHAIVDVARQILQEDLVPQLREWETSGTFPMDVFKRLYDAGVYGIGIPQEYGGLGADFETQFLLSESMAYYDAGFAFTFHGASKSADCLFLGGTPEQKRFAAEQVLAGKAFAFCMTEAESGSDAAATRTTARREGDEYVINGTKTFISGGAIADYFVVVATMDRNLRSKGITLFLVERDRPGVVVGRHEDKMGLRLSPTNEILFKNVRIPADHIIGQEGHGFSIAMRDMEVARPACMAFAVGIMQRAVDEATRYAKQRVCFGAPIIQLQGLSFLLADMLQLTQVSHAVLMQTARQLSAGIPLDGLGSSAKVFVAESAARVASDAVQVFGGYGYMRDFPVEKLIRDAKIFEIFEGTTQIQKVVLAGILKHDKSTDA